MLLARAAVVMVEKNGRLDRTLMLKVDVTGIVCVRDGTVGSPRLSLGWQG